MDKSQAGSKSHQESVSLMDLAERIESLEEILQDYITAPGIIEAQAFVLKDDDGNTRAMLHLAPGGANLGIADDKGRIRAQVSVTHEGAAIGFTDREENARLTLTLNDDTNEPGFTLTGLKGQPSIGCVVKEEGAGYMLVGPEGKMRAFFGVHLDGTSFLSFSDGEEITFSVP